MCAADWGDCVLLIAFSLRLAAVVLRALLLVRAVGCPDGKKKKIVAVATILFLCPCGLVH